MTKVAGPCEYHRVRHDPFVYNEGTRQCGRAQCAQSAVGISIEADAQSDLEAHRALDVLRYHDDESKLDELSGKGGER